MELILEVEMDFSLEDYVKEQKNKKNKDYRLSL